MLKLSGDESVLAPETIIIVGIANLNILWSVVMKNHDIEATSALNHFFNITLTATTANTEIIIKISV